MEDKTQEINEQERKVLQERYRNSIADNPKDSYLNENINDLKIDLDTNFDNIDSDSPGFILKAKRESLGLSVRDVASQLKVRINTICDIESDALIQSTAANFAKDSMKGYCKLINVDYDLICNLYDKKLAKRNDNTEIYVKNFNKKNRTHIYLLSLIGIIIFVTAFYLIYPLLGSSSNNNEVTGDLATINDNVESYEVEGEIIDSSKSNNDEIVIENVALNKEADNVNNDLLIDTNKTVSNKVQSNNNPNELLKNQEQLAVENKKVNINTTVNLVASTKTQTETDKDNKISLNADNKLKDITSKVSVRNREGLASLNSVSIKILSDTAVKVSDSRGKVLKEGNFKRGEILNLTGIPPIKVYVENTRSVSISYMGGDVVTPSAKQVKFTLPQK